MLFGLSYLELIINQLCEQMHDTQAILNRVKIQKNLDQKINQVKSQ